MLFIHQNYVKVFLGKIAWFLLWHSADVCSVAEPLNWDEAEGVLVMK